METTHMESTLRRAWAEVSLDNLAYNYRKIREHVGSGVRFLGVVKADAYGHGSVQVAEKLQRLGADYLAVSSIDEAAELRVNGITMPILILGHTPKEQVGRLIELDIAQAVSCKAKAREYSAEAVAFSQALGGGAPAGGDPAGGVSAGGAFADGAPAGEPAKLKIHIKVDTGMSRLGFLCEGVHFDGGVSGIVEACNLPGLEAEGIFTHLAVADEHDKESERYTHHQLELFEQVVSNAEEKLGRRFLLRHAANTGATATCPASYLDLVRPGLLLYGYGEHAKMLGLKPVMAMKTTVSTVKTYPAGTKISYGGIYTTKKKTRMGVVPYGYADGFSRCLSNRYSLMTPEGLAPVRGKICMDMAMIDLTSMPGVDVGDEIEVFGENNPIEVMAEMAGTIPYELVCAVSKRVPRLYIEQGKIVSRELLLRM